MQIRATGGKVHSTLGAARLTTCQKMAAAQANFRRQSISLLGYFSYMSLRTMLKAKVCAWGVKFARFLTSQRNHVYNQEEHFWQK